MDHFQLGLYEIASNFRSAVLIKNLTQFSHFSGPFYFGSKKWITYNNVYRKLHRTSGLLITYQKMVTKIKISVIDLPIPE